MVKNSDSFSNSKSKVLMLIFIFLNQSNGYDLPKYKLYYCQLYKCI